MDVARDMMTLAGRTSDTIFEENAPHFSSIPAVPFRLPDGTEVGFCRGRGDEGGRERGLDYSWGDMRCMQAIYDPSNTIYSYHTFLTQRNRAQSPIFGRSI